MKQNLYFMFALSLGTYLMMLTGCGRNVADSGDIRPNVVFILADDLGWRDVTFMGSELYETPHIDALAARGMHFTNAYTANSLCSPTRASILTGQYPARIGITIPACHVAEERLEAHIPETAAPGIKVIIPQSATRLDTSYYTLGEALRDAGYVTGHFGKWHVGRAPYDGLHHGFDVDIPNSPIPGPVGGYFSPWVFWETDGPIGENIEDRMAREATQFIRDHKKEPFFLNYWCFSVHTPIDAKREVSGKYYYKLKELGEDYPQQHAPYAAKVETMDNAIGVLMDALADEGILDNTIVIFFSDNGGYATSTKECQTLYWNTLVTSNHPLKKGKASIYEGGTRVPLIVAWPGMIEEGSVCHEIISSIDMYPTILDMIQEEKKEEVLFDGKSFLPALRKESFNSDTLFTYKPFRALAEWPAVSVRAGDYKLIRFWYGGEGISHRYELYNLAEDIGEEQDLSAAMPEKVAGLDAAIDGFLDATGAVIPVPNPLYNFEGQTE